MRGGSSSYIGYGLVAVMAGLVVAAQADPPDAKTVLEQAGTALKAVRTVRYQATGEATGTWAARIPKMTGKVILVANPGGKEARMRVEADVFRSSTPAHMVLVCDGEKVAVCDFEHKMFAQRGLPEGTNLLGSAATVLVSEFVDEEPLPRESTATTIELEGVEKVGDVDCDVVHVVYAENKGEVRWLLAQTDHLPRCVKRTVTSPQGATTLTITVSELELNGEYGAETFKLEKPEDFRDVSEPTGRTERKFLETGTEAPDWTLKDGEGREVSLKSLRGKIVLLEFWATWCGPCRMAMPSIQKMYEHYKDKPVAIFGVNCWQYRERRKIDPVGFMKSQGFSYPILLEAEQVARQYLISGIPASYLIGPDGKILGAFSGWSEFNEQRIERLVEETLKGMGAEPSPTPAPTSAPAGAP